MECLQMWAAVMGMGREGSLLGVFLWRGICRVGSIFTWMLQRHFKFLMPELNLICYQLWWITYQSWHSPHSLLCVFRSLMLSLISSVPIPLLSNLLLNCVHFMVHTSVWNLFFCLLSCFSLFSRLFHLHQCHPCSPPSILKPLDTNGGSKSLDNFPPNLSSNFFINVCSC